TPDPAAEAIMTTDTRMKMASRSLRIGGKDVTLAAICKGSGMIAPQMATMICVVDNDMSTNDVVFALANGKAGNSPIADPGKDLDKFTAALGDLCEELAKDIA